MTETVLDTKEQSPPGETDLQLMRRIKEILRAGSFVVHEAYVDMLPHVVSELVELLTFDEFDNGIIAAVGRVRFAVSIGTLRTPSNTIESVVHFRPLAR